LLEELVQRLREAKSAPLAHKAMFDIEDDLTPVELQEALPKLAELEGPARTAVDSSPAVFVLKKELAEPYTFELVAPGVKLYRGAPAPDGRALVVVLSGRHPRPMMAISLFIQHLPAQLFDVLLMFDETNSHYIDGVAGYADSLLALTQRVHAEFGAGYRRIYHYGVSSGGLPALRMGLMAPAHRSIAIGGLFQWPINRIQSGMVVDAFDPICACNVDKGNALICVHASHKRDIAHAKRVVRAVRASGVRVPDVNEHNILFPIFDDGKLRDMNGALFGYEQLPGEPPRFVDTFGV
jgi:hypothetical protein